MGKSCSCIKSCQNEPSQIVQDEIKDTQSTQAVPAKTIERPPEITLGDLIKLQTLIRGYLDRRRLKELSRTKTLVMNFDELQSGRKINFYRRPTNSEVESTHFSFIERIEKKLGPFDCRDLKDESILKKLPVNDGAGGLYTGDLNALNQYQGFGVLLKKDGSKYEGLWHNGKPQGRGRMIYADGSVIEGEWLDGKVNGLGLHLDPKGSIYEGELMNNRYHGNGVQKLVDGSRFSGNFVNGSRNGKGEFFWADGTSYSGEFTNDKFHGFGTYTWNNKSQYIGEWEMNKKTGKGIFCYNDGRKYEGDFLNDQKHGFGIFTWPDGKRYEGEWKEGKQSGRGVMFTANGQRIEGMWDDAKLIET